MLTQEQSQAVEMACKASAGVFRLSGPAGTGKTTTLKAILEENPGAMLLTPTGRAAVRAREVTGKPADTIHKWLYNPSSVAGGGVKFSRKESADGATLLVIDEASMVTRQMWKDIDAMARKKRMPVLLVGDGFQLPPVEPGCDVPFSVFDAAFPVDGSVELTQVFRQAAGSPVINAATRVRQSTTWMEAKTAAMEELENVRDPVDASMQMHAGGDDHVVICHQNATRVALNVRLRQSLRGMKPRDDIAPGEPLLIRRNVRELDLWNGAIEPCPQFTRSEDVRGYGKETATFHLGAMNGGTVAIHQVTTRAGKDKDIPSEFQELLWRQHHARLVRANLGYVLSCHAAQGSEWPHVVLVLEPSLGVMPEPERIRWLYTAVSRASSTVALAA